MAVSVLLYSADGPDETPGLADVRVAGLTDRQLLWIDLSSPTDQEQQQVAELLDCDRKLLAIPTSAGERPSLVNYDDFFRITARAVSKQGQQDSDKDPDRDPDGAKVAKHGSPANGKGHDWFTLIAGRNYVATVHAAGTDFLDGLRKRERGNSMIGALSEEAFTASVLDWLLDTYFQANDSLVREIDRIEVSLLSKKMPPEHLGALVTARRRVTESRRSLKSHRDVFYGLTRPDFTANGVEQEKAYYDLVNRHYERAEDELDSARDLVIGSFELLSTRAAQRTNDTMRALTFVTVLMGSLALIAGIMGMNFQLKFFESGANGFALVSGGMLGLSALALAVGRRRGWF